MAGFFDVMPSGYGQGATGYVDPAEQRRMMLLALGASLLGARKGYEGQAIGQGLMGGLMLNRQSALDAAKLAEERQQSQLRDLQMQQLTRGMQRQDQIDALAPKFQGAEYAGPPTPSGETAGRMPNNTAGYLDALQAIDPTKAIGLRVAMQKELPYDKPKPEHFTPASLAVYQRTGNMADLVPYVAPPKEQWEPTQAPPGVPSGQYWERERNTGAVRAVGSRPQSVNVNMPPIERAEQQGKGAANVKYYGELKTAADAARKENGILDDMIRNPLETGAHVPLASKAANWMVSLGASGDAVKQYATDSQRFTSDAMQLVLNQQLAQKGPQTESDAQRMAQTVGQISNTRDANVAIAKFRKAQNNRAIKQHMFYDRWWNAKGTYEGADQAWFDGEGGKSLFDTEPVLRGISSSSGGGVRARADEIIGR